MALSIATRNRMLTIILPVVLCIIFSSSVQGCGIATHIAIAHKARNHYKQITANHDYRKLLDKHEDAFMGGAPYPDSYYSSFCYGGQYQNISEDTHWTPFLNASINYIRGLPKPWNDSTEKLVVFMMGVMSHQVADVLWHSLGIDQGFLTTMGMVNFHGSFSKAHEAGDLGGDIINNYSYDIDHYIDPEENWYIPIDDLYNIYNNMYGKPAIDKEAIETCSTLLLVGAIAEFIGASELFQEVASTSPFLVDNLQNYFLGGLEDMSAWTFNKWHDMANMLENGTSNCRVPHNPLFINCTKPAELFNRHGGQEEINGYFQQPQLKGLTIKDIDIQPTLRGVSITPKLHLKEKLMDIKKQAKIARQKHREMNTMVTRYRNSNINFNVNESEAYLGWALAKGDFDQDGNEDLAIGAPYYGEDENPYMGRVFILYSDENGINSKGKYDYYYPLNLNNLTLGYNRIISGLPGKKSRFGFSLTVLDVNLDGIPDLAVGAPSISFDNPLLYHGSVYIYFGKGESRIWAIPNITLTCQSKYCNLGYSLSSADVTGDGHADLIIGSPYWSKSKDLVQNGFIVALPSDKSYFGPQTIAVETLKWRMEGDQPYGWFGYNLYSRNDVLFVDQPYYRKCEDPSVFSKNDTQSIGKTHILNFGKKYPLLKNSSIEGEHKFDMVGLSNDIGDPFGNGSQVLAVSVPGADVDGIILTLPWQLSQGGAVLLYQINPDSSMTKIATYESDRRYARFGSLVRFEDINDDEIDDLIISAPFRNEDPSSLINFYFNGETYVFYGGKNFTVGNATKSKHCDIISPCPEKVADIVFDNAYDDSDASYFGDHGLVLRTKNQTQLIMSAARNTDSFAGSYYVESGKVYVYNLKWNIQPNRKLFL